jgi:hypothetical protein
MSSGRRRPTESKSVNHSQQRERELTDRAYRRGAVRNIVLFRYRPGTSEADLQQVRDRFHALQSSHRDGEPYILGIESGHQNSPEGLGQGFQRAFIVSFASEGDRNYYLGEPLITDPDLYDPMHHAFKTFIGSHLDPHQGSALVFDFTA